MEKRWGRNIPKCGPLDVRIKGDLKEETKVKWTKFLAYSID